MVTMTRALGLMSGTSLDGIDIALVTTDGEAWVERGPALSIAYDDAFRNRLKQGLADAMAINDRRQRPGILGELETDLTMRHVSAVTEFFRRHPESRDAVDLIGFHGQTVLHRPDQALTVQIGDGQRLAAETGIDVVYDMRAADMTRGGQGAPLVPAYHAALAAGLGREALPVCFVNIGGISNLTFIDGAGGIVAFDSGPGNTLIDQWVEALSGFAYDDGGAIAERGRLLPDLARRYLEHPFFTANRRKSLDRNDFRPPAPGEAGLEDGARTLAHVTARAILASVRHLPAAPKTLVICGGGRHNRVIMADLATLAEGLDAKVIKADALGLNGDSLEAEAWAYLAVRSVKGLPLTYPGTTGVDEALTGGILCKA